MCPLYMHIEGEFRVDEICPHDPLPFCGDLKVHSWVLTSDSEVLRAGDDFGITGLTDPPWRLSVRALLVCATPEFAAQLK